ncbi:DUF3558 domain-containing protein [Nocardia farcinica]|uniref:DUF3558 domain-containing protein n=1 Tax=Nocardia farcinica TaxID=37329 RepID=UPI001894361B|nr:DUF3558 domain-containing protein [Nocardia farcinica]MBF6269663.1 DUF3558 domain-containing protein [Nocardia farcinica]MCZ9329745.1 DUF3558 domain-containing protein [Nocardia farcinica]
MHITATVARTVIAVATLLGLVTGCGTVDLGGTRPGTPTPAEPEMDNLLDPCTDIPDEWLIELGLDPSTERNIVNPDKVSSWRICGWEPSVFSYRMDLLSTSHTIEDTRKNPKIEIIREITIGSRIGLVTRDRIERSSCYVSLPAEQGMFEIAVGWFDDRPIEESCDLAIRHAITLEPHLPK